MTAGRPLDLVCLSYLADAHVLRVTAYPPVNHGTVVREMTSSIAGDGPLTALTAAALGLRVGLVANQVGADPAGQRLIGRLEAAGIHHAISPNPTAGTPQLTVVTDDADTRTWFVWLDAAYAQLHDTDLGLLTQARLAYIDCYHAITPAAARAVSAADDTPLLLNLGGDPPTDLITAAADRRRVAAVQTSLDKADAARAEDLADALFDRLRPEAAIVTLGRFGALARTRQGLHQVDTVTTTVRHTHGAGAAFSAGYAHALLTGADIEVALRAGCHVGTAHCAGEKLITTRQSTAATSAVHA